MYVPDSVCELICLKYYLSIIIKYAPNSISMAAVINIILLYTTHPFKTGKHLYEKPLLMKQRTLYSAVFTNDYFR